MFHGKGDSTLADDLAKLPESIELLNSGVLDNASFKKILTTSDNKLKEAKKFIKQVYKIYAVDGGKELIDGGVFASGYFKNQISMADNLKQFGSRINEMFSIYSQKETKELLDDGILPAFFMLNVHDDKSAEIVANYIKTIHAVRIEIKRLLSEKVIGNDYINKRFLPYSSLYSSLTGPNSSTPLLLIRVHELQTIGNIKDLIRVYELDATKKLIAAKVIAPDYIGSNRNLALIESRITNAAKILELKETMILIKEGHFPPALLIDAPFNDDMKTPLDDYATKKSFIMFYYKLFSMRATQELLDANVIKLPDYTKYLMLFFIAHDGDLAAAKKEILSLYKKPENQDLIEKNRAFTGGAMHGIFHDKSVPRDVSKMVGEYVSKRDAQSAASTRKAAADESKTQLKDAEDRIHKKRNN